MTDYETNLARIRGRIAGACTRAGRDPSTVELIAVSKGHDVAAIQALRELGVTSFGESYVPEWQDKADAVSGVDWHFIGHLQSNKARFVVDRARLIHSVDRTSLMRALARRSEAPVDILLQINVGADPAKSGADPAAVLESLAASMSFDGLSVRGLMTMPPFTENAEDARPHFRALRDAFERCRDWLGTHAPDRAAGFTELSMGMSHDFEVAIEEGATMIRVGTALFGARR